METTQQLLTSHSESPFPQTISYNEDTKIKSPKIDWQLKEETESLFRLFKKILNCDMKLNRESEKKLAEDAKALMSRLNDLTTKNKMRPAYDISVYTISKIINLIRILIFYMIESKSSATHQIKQSLMFLVEEVINDLETLDLNQANEEDDLLGANFRKFFEAFKTIDKEMKEFQKSTYFSKIDLLKKQTIDKKEISFTFALNAVSKFRDVYEVKGDLFKINMIPFTLNFSNYRSLNEKSGENKIDVELRCHLALKSNWSFNVRSEYRLMSLLSTSGRISRTDFSFSDLRVKSGKFREKIDLNELLRPESAYIAYDTDTVLIHFDFVIYNLTNLHLDDQ